VSLLSLSIGDYGPLAGTAPVPDGPLVPGEGVRLAPFHARRHPTPEMMAQIQRVRRTGLTLAPEAGSQRLRQVINKNLTEEAIMDSARRAFAAGWQLLKLYFMIGLPRETKEDREGITALARQILAAAPRGSRPRPQCQPLELHPQAHTPVSVGAPGRFAWNAAAGSTKSRTGLRQKNIQTKWNSAARPGWRACFPGATGVWRQVLLEAHRRGCPPGRLERTYAAGTLARGFCCRGVDPDFYLRERGWRNSCPGTTWTAG